MSRSRQLQSDQARQAEAALQTALNDTTPTLWRDLSQAAAREQASGQSPEFGWASLNLLQNEVLRHLKPHAIRDLRGPDAYARVLQLSCLPALLTWALTRGSYEVEPELLSALARTPLKEVPRHLITRLPEYTAHVRYQGRLFGREVDGVFLHPTLHEGTLHLHCVTHWRENGQTRVCPHPIRLGDPDLQTCLEQTYAVNRAEHERAGATIAFSEAQLEHSRASTQLCLNLALYLSADEPDLSGNRRTPPRPGRAERPGHTHVLQVGVRFATALRRAQAQATGDAESSGSGATGKTRAVHTRAAHWHLYRTGPGRQELTLHWLHPIIVGAQALEEDQTLPVTARRVRRDPAPDPVGEKSQDADNGKRHD